jgi:VanZ family protein
MAGLRKYCVSAVALAFLYAMTDEFHQLFVAGRAGRFIDVCIDTAGAVIGVLILAIIIKFHYNNTKYQV